MEQFEQLLTCAICLDRYRNPKLLPCQHSFCMEPCMDGLVDYVRRQVKCPECRAEHRIPYQVRGLFNPDFFPISFVVLKNEKKKKNSSNGVDRKKKRREKTCLNSWKGKNISDDLVSEIIKRIKLNINKISNPTRVPFLVFIQRRIRARSLVKLDKNFTQFLHSDASRPFVFLYPCVQSVHVKKKKRKRGPTSNVTRLSLIKSGDANDKRWIKLGGGGERKEGRNAIGNDPSFFLSPSMKFNFR